MQLWSPEGDPTPGGNIADVIRRNQERMKDGEAAQRMKDAALWCPVGIARCLLTQPAYPCMQCHAPPTRNRALPAAGPAVLHSVDSRLIAALTDNPELLRALMHVGAGVVGRAAGGAQRAARERCS